MAKYVQYPITGPFMNREVPESKVKPGTFGDLVGADGRYSGCLRKLYGMSEVVDLDGVASAVNMGGIDTYDGPSFFKYVTFHKRGTSDTFRGFIVRWDSQDDNTDEQVDLIYTTDGSTWASHSVWAAGNSIASTLDMDCDNHEGFLFVAVDTKNTKTIYWTGSALTTVDMGPGDFSAELGALTESTDSVDSSYNLRGNGVYQVAYRFYDSTRGINSALSDPLTVTLDHMKTTKATGTISFSSAGGDSGLLVEADRIAINGRSYEVMDQASPVATTATNLSLHFNGNDAATAAYDMSPSRHAMTFVGTAQLDTTQKKFGASSLLLDGDSDYVTAADHADWNFGAGEFTVDCSGRFNSVPSGGFQTLVGQWNDSSDRNWVLGLAESGGTTTIRLYASVDGSAITTHDSGVAKGTADFTGKTLFNGTSTLCIGAYLSSGSPQNYLDGWIDEVRIIKGDAYWTAAFTSPTTQYINTGGEVNINGISSIASHAAALADVINADSSAVVRLEMPIRSRSRRLVLIRTIYRLVGPH
jgi:hypothetical protein